MDKNKDYYNILGVSFQDDSTQIKKKYYKLSFKYHPDKNDSDDASLFNLINEAYNVLCNEELRKEYDVKSRFGKNYNEYYELFDIDYDFSYKDAKDKFENFKKYEVNNVIVEIDDSFSSKVEYERWVKCKTCDGTGKDFSSKIVIRDNDGNVVKIFDSDDGCDFCNGTGKGYNNEPCTFCHGMGKIGINKCDSCNGEGRILGKQKLKNIKLTGDETKIEAMGHYSKNGIGCLILKKIIK